MVHVPTMIKTRCLESRSRNLGWSRKHWPTERCIRNVGGNARDWQILIRESAVFSHIFQYFSYLPTFFELAGGNFITPFGWLPFVEMTDLVDRCVFPSKFAVKTFDPEAGTARFFSNIFYFYHLRISDPIWTNLFFCRWVGKNHQLRYEPPGCWLVTDMKWNIRKRFRGSQSKPLFATRG